MSYKGEIGDVVESGRGDGDISSFEWKIPDFLSLACEGEDSYDSPLFNACDGRWVFSIFPKGLWRNSPSDWVSLCLVRWDSGPPKTLNVTLGIRGPEGVENKKGIEQEFSTDDRACCWYEFYRRSELTEQNSRLMPGNNLTLTLDMKSVVPSVARDASTQTDEDCKEAAVPIDVNESSEKQGGETALEDYGKLLTSDENSDATVVVGSVEFRVHKAILSVRSPALSVSLQHESRERTSSRIVIEDSEPDVFKDFLQYLYTGNVQSLTDQNVFGLYRVADKYLADDLKLLCLKHIQVTLSVQTFCDTIKLALTHGENDLLQLAIDFASKNISSIIRSVEWQNFIQEYPREANEILIKCI